MLIWQKKNESRNEMHSLHDLKLRSLKISRHQSNQLGLRREIRYLNSNRQHLNSRINNILIEIENINTRIGRLSSEIQKEEEKKKFYFEEQNRFKVIFSEFAKNPEPFFKNNQACISFETEISTSLVDIVPDPVVIVQVCPAGCVSTVTAYAAPSATCVVKACVPAAVTHHIFFYFGET